jgi:transposase-like protein
LRLEVPSSQFEQAEQLLLDWDSTEGAMREAIRCPECKSLRVDYPQFTRKSLLTNLAVGLAAEVGVVEKQYYCQDCHFTWPREGTKPRRDRQHLAPYYFIEGVEQTEPRKAA